MVQIFLHQFNTSACRCLDHTGNIIKYALRIWMDFLKIYWVWRIKCWWVFVQSPLNCTIPSRFTICSLLVKTTLWLCVSFHFMDLCWNTHCMSNFIYLRLPPVHEGLVPNVSRLEWMHIKVSICTIMNKIFT